MTTNNLYNSFGRPSPANYKSETEYTEALSPAKQKEGHIRRAIEEAQEKLGLNDLLGEAWDDD